MSSVRLIPNCLFSYKWDWNRDSPTWTISHTNVNTVYPDSTIADPKKSRSCMWTCGNTTTFHCSLPIASNGKLEDVIEVTPMPTPRKAPVVREPVETPQHSTARFPIASNGKLVDVIECTPTRLRPQHLPTQNVAIQEKGKFPIFLFPLIAFQIDLLELSKQVDPLLIQNLNFYRYFSKYYTKEVLC